MSKRDYILADSKAVNELIEKMSEFIISKMKTTNESVLIGIIKRGDIIAGRINNIIREKTGKDIPVGKIDINLYRDDLSLIDYHPTIEHTDIPFDINGKNIFLIDDVFFTGRTIRSALNEIIDFGRPRKILFCTLVDRNSHELPIKPDFAAIDINIPNKNNVNVELNECDSHDRIMIIKED